MKNIQNIIKDICSTHHVVGAFLGGSHSSRFNDSYSDYDYGIVLRDEFDLSLVVNDLSNTFGEIIHIVEKDFSSAYHFNFNNNRFEVRLVFSKYITATKEKLLKSYLLDFSEQELLENIKRGLYFYKTLEMQSYIDCIHYPEKLKSQIIDKYLVLLDKSNLEIPVLRGDSYLILNYLNDLYAAAIVLAHAQRKIFTTSFKHELQLMSSFSLTAQIFFKSMNDLIKNPSQKTYKTFAIDLAQFKIELSYD